MDAVAAGERIPFVQYVACLAAVSSLQRIFSERLSMTARPTSFPIKIKWPNDIYSVQTDSPLKIGGILCQSCNVQNTFKVVVGMGLNVSNNEPTTCVNDILSAVATARGMTVEAATREEVLALFLNDFEAFMQVLEREGFDPLRGTYERYWMHTNQVLAIQESKNSMTKTEVTITGLTSSGYLKAVDAFGAEYELHPDGNSLDMMNGLIKRKLL